jgi:1-acyl-sn-glycerol-3-phosphate acyltransferase
LARQDHALPPPAGALRRGQADLTALRRGLEVLAAGQILAVAPEGTRSKDGRLQPANSGVVLLALHSGAPLLPLVHHGGEGLWRNVVRLRRTAFKIVVGRPFYLDAAGAKITREVRQQMAQEIMYQMAALLPPEYRGHYADLGAATEAYLRFPEGSATVGATGRPGGALPIDRGAQGGGHRGG